MKHTTRFNPTSNGPLHLGHVYISLFNEHVAHSSGGKFYVRFENNQVDTLYSTDCMLANLYCEQQREALEWLQIPVDGWDRQSDMELELKQFVANHGWWIPEYRWPYNIPIDPARGDYNLEHGEWYPYAPYLTYCKVIYDEVQGVNLLIRGDDLRGEFSLYQHFRTLFGLPTVDHYYLPRIYGPNGNTISKFYGAKSVLEYRDAGWSPGAIIDLLAQSALKVPADGWKLTNVKGTPRLAEEFSI